MLILKEFNTCMIATPGIKGFGLVDISKEDLGKYFLEIKKHSSRCKFKNCLHIKEPECAVIKNLATKEIPTVFQENEWRGSFVNLLTVVELILSLLRYRFIYWFKS